MGKDNVKDKKNRHYSKREKSYRYSHDEDGNYRNGGIYERRRRIFRREKIANQEDGGSNILEGIVEYEGNQLENNV